MHVAGHKKMWAYGYLITPPQPEGQLAEIQKLLDEEHSEAKRRAHTWEGRFVHEEAVTHILVVSDSPDQHQAVNQKLEAALGAIEAGYSLTAPLAVATEDERPTGTRPPTEIE
jgi:hypothetical protein